MGDRVLGVLHFAANIEKGGWTTTVRDLQNFLVGTQLSGKVVANPPRPRILAPVPQKLFPLKGLLQFGQKKR